MSGAPTSVFPFLERTKAGAIVPTARLAFSAATLSWSPADARTIAGQLLVAAEVAESEAKRLTDDPAAAQLAFEPVAGRA